MVVKGTQDPDYGFDIGGWTGCIEEIWLSEDESKTWVCEVRWDQQTLKSMGKTLCQKCEDDNLDFTRMRLDESELEPA